MKNQITIKALGLSAIIFLLTLAYNTALACCPCETNINTLQEPGVESDFAGDPISLVSGKVLLFVAVDSGDNYIYFEYDSLGRKVVRADNNGYFCYIYDGMNLVADYDVNNGRITRTYTYGPGVDNIQSMTIYDANGDPEETYYYIKDASNTVYALVDGNGEIKEYYYYDAFGNFKMRDKDYNLITESVYGNRFMFQGREYDYDTALYYFRARWYEPETGRWLSPDPIGISGGLNLYAFCGNDPVNFVDPMGTLSSYVEEEKMRISYELEKGESKVIYLFKIEDFIDFFKKVDSNNKITWMKITAHGIFGSPGSITLGKGVINTYNDDYCESGRILGINSEGIKPYIQNAFSPNADVILKVCYGADLAKAIDSIRPDLNVVGYNGIVHYPFYVFKFAAWGYGKVTY